MNSVLNLGLNDVIFQKLVLENGNERFALDTYRRFLQSYGCTVEDKDPALYEEIIESVKTKEDCVHIHQVSIEGMQEIVDEFKRIFEPPTDPWNQLENALLKLMSIWESAP
jgi:pyruvate, orthophosphate dikinase